MSLEVQQCLFTKLQLSNLKMHNMGLTAFRKSNGFIYTRIGNPTIHALEQNIAELENGFGGIATSSGMGAVSSVYMALLGAGSHIISSDAVYGPARGILEQDFSRYNVEASFCEYFRN